MTLARFFARPFHPPTTHYPIALLTTSLLWDVISLLVRAQPWTELAYWTLAAGLGFAALAATFGMVDAVRFVWRDEHPPRPAVGRLAVAHLSLVLAGVALFGASFYLRRPVEVKPAAVVVSILGALALLVGGWAGGELVYAEGIGTAETRH